VPLDVRLTVQRARQQQVWAAAVQQILGAERRGGGNLVWRLETSS